MSGPEFGETLSAEGQQRANLRAVLVAEGVTFTPTSDGREIARPTVRRGREDWTRRALMALDFAPWGNSGTWIRETGGDAK